MTNSDTDRLARIRRTLDPCGQAHLLAHWEGLNDSQRAELLDDIEQIPFAGLDRLIAAHVRVAQPFTLPVDISTRKEHPMVRRQRRPDPVMSEIWAILQPKRAEKPDSNWSIHCWPLMAHTVLSDAELLFMPARMILSLSLRVQQDREWPAAL